MEIVDAGADTQCAKNISTNSCSRTLSSCRVSSERNPKQEKKMRKENTHPASTIYTPFSHYPFDVPRNSRCLSLTPWCHHAPRRQSSSSSAVADWRCCRMLNNCQIKCDPHTHHPLPLSPSLSLSLPPSPTLSLCHSLSKHRFSKRKGLSQHAVRGVVPRESVCRDFVCGWCGIKRRGVSQHRVRRWRPREEVCPTPFPSVWFQKRV